MLKAAYASQLLSETGHSLSPGSDCAPEDLNSSNNHEVNRHFTPVFCASALSPHVYSDDCLVPGGEGEGKKSTLLRALGYAYVTESIPRPPDATNHYMDNQTYEMIKKIKISGRKISDHDVEVLTRSLIDNYAGNDDEKSSALDARMIDVEQNEHSLIPENTMEVLSSGPDSGTLPAALADCIETFIRRSGVCSLQCISSVCVYNDSSSSSTLRVRSLTASSVASSSGINAMPYEILLVTASSYDSEYCEASDTLSDVRVLDSSLVTLAVLGLGDYCAFSAAKSRDIASSLPSASTILKFMLRCGGSLAGSHCSRGVDSPFSRCRNVASASISGVSAFVRSCIPSCRAMVEIKSLTVSGTGTIWLRRRCGSVLNSAAAFSRSIPITSQSKRAAFT